ncbi:MAG: heavy-metal-associated domain-containing protein [bacterium]|nr:heavy-metal-associated domain-containing protein [bacterium]
MKKLSVFTIAFLALFAFALAPLSQAGEGCGSASHAAKKTTDAKLASAKTCQASDAKACAASLGMTVEECQALCSQYTLVTMDIKGMTCTGCEKSIEASLVKVPGVHKVAKISHEEGKAMVFVDPKKAGNDVLVKTVADKGYTVDIIPAVATADTKVETKAVDAKGCTAAQKAACAAKGLPCGTKTGDAKAKKTADGTN